MTKHQPHIKVEQGSLSRRTDIAARVLLVLLWGFTLLIYNRLPEQIPSHFNARGVADDYSSKGFLFLLPVIATAMVVLLTILNRYPHKFNYIVKITEQNAPYQYKNAMLMINVLKLVTVLVFSVIVVVIYLGASGGNDPGPGLVISLALLLQVPLFYLLYKSAKNG
jgi:uncharacterized membrane protein